MVSHGVRVKRVVYIYMHEDCMYLDAAPINGRGRAVPHIVHPFSEFESRERHICRGAKTPGHAPRKGTLSGRPHMDHSAGTGG